MLRISSEIAQQDQDTHRHSKWEKCERERERPNGIINLFAYIYQAVSMHYAKDQFKCIRFYLNKQASKSI